ncbi:MAG: hexokinase [Oscillospiraceae bacterium]|nr:hexokinase [Oscillospiraceae bacterium]
MGNIIDETNELLREISMHPDLNNIQELTNSFLSEMEKGLYGEVSSIPMIPTYISAIGTPSEDDPVIAVDAGGTNLRVALVTFIDGKPIVSRLEKYSMPGSLFEISSDDFFSQLAEKILPLTEVSDKIGFCFSYPAEIFPNRDGKIMCLTKEVSVTDSEGQILGQGIKKKLSEMGVSKDLSFTLLNDTVAGLMGGVAEFTLSCFDGICGLILGTGYNTCCLEKGENISKLVKAPDMIINCESGNFTKALRGEVDKMIDTTAEYPEVNTLERMLSGAYIGKIVTNMAHFAAQKGLLSNGFNEVLPLFAAPELDDFLRGTANRVTMMCVDSDAVVLRELIDKTFERASRLVCANIAALCLRCDGGKSAEKPFCVVAEGSTFYKSLLFREKLDKYVKSEIEGKLHRFIVFKQAENATLTGSALSALLG